MEADPDFFLINVVAKGNVDGRKPIFPPPLQILDWRRAPTLGSYAYDVMHISVPAMICIGASIQTVFLSSLLHGPEYGVLLCLPHTTSIVHPN